MWPSKALWRFVRRRALWSGIFGPSRFWQAVAFAVYGRDLLRRFLGSHDEVLHVDKLGVGRYLSVETMRPLTRRRRRKLVKAGEHVPTKRELEASAWTLARARRAS